MCWWRRARSLVITGAEMLGVTPAVALELYGKFFVQYVQKMVRAARWGQRCVAPKSRRACCVLLCRSAPGRASARGAAAP